MLNYGKLLLAGILWKQRSNYDADFTIWYACLAVLVSQLLRFLNSNNFIHNLLNPLTGRLETATVVKEEMICEHREMCLLLLQEEESLLVMYFIWSSFVFSSVRSPSIAPVKKWIAHREERSLDYVRALFPGLSFRNHTPFFRSARRYSGCFVSCDDCSAHHRDRVS